MSYNSNKAYRNSLSYSFSSSTSGASEYAPTSSQMEYSNKTVISYSGSSNTNYSTPLFSNNDGSGNGLGNNRNYIGSASRKGMGMGKGGGSGERAGRGGGKGIGSGRGGRGGGGMRQGHINIPNQFRKDQKNKFQSDEVDSAINNIQQTDLDIKTQKNPLDIIIEKLEVLRNSKRISGTPKISKKFLMEKNRKKESKKATIK